MVKLIVGMMGSSVANGAKSITTPEAVRSFLDVCRAHSVDELE